MPRLSPPLAQISLRFPITLSIKDPPSNSTTQPQFFLGCVIPLVCRIKSKCNVYTICRQTQLSTRWYANLLNVNLNYMFRPQSFAIIRLYKRPQSDDGQTLWPKYVVEI